MTDNNAPHSNSTPRAKFQNMKLIEWAVGVLRLCFIYLFSIWNHQKLNYINGNLMSVSWGHEVGQGSGILNHGSP